MPRKYTDAQKKSARKWDAAHLDRISVVLPKGEKESVKLHAEARGESVNGFINRAISETMERDNSASRRDALTGVQASQEGQKDPPEGEI